MKKLILLMLLLFCITGIAGNRSFSSAPHSKGGFFGGYDVNVAIRGQIVYPNGVFANNCTVHLTLDGQQMFRPAITDYKGMYYFYNMPSNKNYFMEVYFGNVLIGSLPVHVGVKPNVSGTFWDIPPVTVRFP